MTSTPKKSIFHIESALILLALIMSCTMILCCKVSNAKTISYMMINKSSRGAGFTKPDRLKRYKVKKTGTSASIKIDKYWGSYDIKAKTRGKTIFHIKYKVKGKKKWRKLTVRVLVTYKKKYAKLAFKRQNKYRKRHKKKPIKWSDVAYRFAQFRLKSSGFDRHQNLQNDAKLFFGQSYYTAHIKVGENLIWSTVTHPPAMAVKLWKNSDRHRKNMLRKEYRCGAIALTKSTWCAVFFENSPKTLINT